MDDAPTMLDRLEGEDAEHFEARPRLLDAAGRRLRARRDPGPRPRLLHPHGLRVRVRPARRPVRGRRRRPLRRPVEELGGPETPAVGWAAGIERIAARARGPGGAEEPPRGCLRRRRRRPARAALALVVELRRAGLAAELDLAGRRFKGQMKQADRSGAALSRCILEQGDEQPQLRDMDDRRAARDRPRPAVVEKRQGSTRMSRACPSRCARTPTATPGAGRCSPTASTPTVRVAGWVHRRRDHGGLIFIDLRDRTGLVQLVFNPDEAGGGARARPQAARRGRDQRQRRGRASARRRPSTPTCRPARSRSGSPSAELLADAETPPFEIEGFSGEVGEETRLRYRYLDLRRERMREALELRAPGRSGRCATS